MDASTTSLNTNVTDVETVSSSPSHFNDFDSEADHKHKSDHNGGEPHDHTNPHREGYDMYFFTLTKTHITYLKYALYIILILTYHAYLAYAIYYHAHNNLPVGWCHGLGFVCIWTIITYVYLAGWVLWKKILKEEHRDGFRQMCNKISIEYLSRKYVQLAIYAAFVLAVLIFLLVDCWNEKERLVSIVGIIFLLMVGIVFSKFPKKINWRQVWELLNLLLLLLDSLLFY